MNEQTFERRAQAWLELGPNAAPPDAVQAVFAAIATVAQERPPLRLAGRAMPASRSAIFAAAAGVVVAVVAVGAILIRQSPDVATREPGDLLYDYPDATTVFERSGGPASTDGLVEVGELTGGRAFVIGASCTGGGEMVLGVHYPKGIQAVPSGGGDAPPPEPIKSVDIACDGTPVHTNFGSDFGPPDDPYNVVLDMSAGTTWQVAAGVYRAFATPPSFPAVETSEGWHLLMDGGTMLTTGHPGGGIGIQVPSQATAIAVLVQCSGSPITITTSPPGEPTVVSCDDPSRTTRVEYPAEGLSFDVNVGTDRVAWVRLVSEANGEISAPRPTAPPMPPEIAGTGYAEADGSYLVLGTLGSNEQSFIQLAGAQAGLAGGDFVGVATPNAGGSRLELWSISGETAVRTVAEVPAPGNIYRSWVDATHEQVFYGVFNPDFSAEWHRVAFDGSGDRVIASAQAGWHLADADLAVDDSVFVVDWCPAPGSTCTRAIFDAATGELREVALSGDRTCELVDVVDGQVVARSAPTCADGEPTALTVTPLDGGERRVLVTRPGSGVIVRSSDGPSLLYTDVVSEAKTTLGIVDLAGGAPRPLVSFDGDQALVPWPSTVRLPAGDWVLLATILGDTPSNQSIGRPVPRLLNVVTGEQIELVNLPHSEP